MIVLDTRNRKFRLLGEIGASIQCVVLGLERLQAGRDVLHHDHAAFCLLAFGLERLLKCSLFIFQFSENGEFTSVRKFGHRLLDLHREVFTLGAEGMKGSARSREDLDFSQRDPLLGQLLEALDAFADRGRYFELDAVGGTAIDPNLAPRERWEAVLAKVFQGDYALLLTPNPNPAQKFTASLLVERLQRYLRALAQAVFYTVGDDAKSLVDRLGDYLHLHDGELAWVWYPRSS